MKIFNMLRFLLMFAGLAVVSIAIGTVNSAIGWTVLGTGVFLIGLFANKIEDGL